MTDLKKFKTSASGSDVLKEDALKKEVHATEINPPNAIPYLGNKRPKRHLYAGMLFPSRIVKDASEQITECKNS